MYLLKFRPDLKVKDRIGKTCLHIILGYNDLRYASMRTNHAWSRSCKQRKEDAQKVLVALITAGADVYARTNSGTTVSEIAYRYKRIDLWVKVLKACGYDHWEVLARGGLNVGWVESAEDEEGDDDDGGDDDEDNEDDYESDDDDESDDGGGGDYDRGSDYDDEM
jgi:hypothetical protein